MRLRCVSSVSIPCVLAFGAMPLLSCSDAAAAAVTDNLVYQFDADSDQDGSDGWQSSVEPAASAETLPVAVVDAGGPTHVVQGNAKFFRASGSSQAFTSNFGSSNLTSAPSYTDWSLELWIRRNGNSFHPGGEQAVFGLASNDTTNFIFLYANDADGGTLTLDHRDRRPLSSNRDTVLLNGVDLSDADWHHVVIAYDDAIEGSAYGSLNVYLDGNATPIYQKLNSSVDNKEGGGSTFDMMSAFAIQAGEANRNFNGDIGLIRFYGDVLSGAEVNQNYNDLATSYVVPEPTAAIVPLVMLCGLARRRCRGQQV